MYIPAGHPYKKSRFSTRPNLKFTVGEEFDVIIDDTTSETHEINAGPATHGVSETPYGRAPSN